MTTSEADVPDVEIEAEAASGEANENGAGADAANNDNLDNNRENKDTSADDAPDVKLQENGENKSNEENSKPAPQDAPVSKTATGATDAEASASTETSTSTKASVPSPPVKKAPKAGSSTFIHDPNKITLKFLFAGRDGINVIIDCKPNDTVGEVKGALLSVWPKGKFITIVLCGCFLVETFERGVVLSWFDTVHFGCDDSRQTHSTSPSS